MWSQPGVAVPSGTLTTPKVVPHLGVPVDFLIFRSILARNGSGMDENQHNLVKMARNFDASPAVTTGRPQDPYVVSKREVSGSVRPVSVRFGPF